MTDGTSGTLPVTDVPYQQSENSQPENKASFRKLQQSRLPPTSVARRIPYLPIRQDRTDFAGLGQAFREDMEGD